MGYSQARDVPAQKPLQQAINYQHLQQLVATQLEMFYSRVQFVIGL